MGACCTGPAVHRMQQFWVNSAGCLTFLKCSDCKLFFSDTLVTADAFGARRSLAARVFNFVGMLAYCPPAHGAWCLAGMQCR